MPWHRERDLEKEQYWRTQLANCSKSGLSGAAYCRHNGVSYSQFASWKTAIKERDAESHKRSTNNRPLGERRQKPVSLNNRERFVDFAPVKVIERRESELPPISLEIVLRRGFVVRVNSGCPLGFLSDVVSTLERC